MDSENSAQLLCNMKYKYAISTVVYNLQNIHVFFLFFIINRHNKALGDMSHHLNLAFSFLNYWHISAVMTSAVCCALMCEEDLLPAKKTLVECFLFLDSTEVVMY